MLETYFVKPQTVDRIRAGWIGAEIERYAGWLTEQGYSARTVLARRYPESLIGWPQQPTPVQATVDGT